MSNLYLKNTVSAFSCADEIFIGFGISSDFGITIKNNEKNIRIINKLKKEGFSIKDLKGNELLNKLKKNNFLTDKKPENKDNYNRNHLFIDFLESIDELKGSAYLEINTKKFILILGLGAIGSMIAYQLVQFGFNNIIAVDNDTVSFTDITRIPVWDVQSIQKSKVLELHRIIKERFNVEIKSYNQMVSSKLLKEIFNNYKISLVISATGLNAQLPLDVARLCKINSVSYLIASYSHHLCKIGPTFSPNGPFDLLDIDSNFRKRFGYSFFTKEIVPSHYIHPSVNFNILITAGLAFKEALFYLINKIDWMETIGKQIVFSPLTSESYIEDYAYIFK